MNLLANIADIITPLLAVIGVTVLTPFLMWGLTSWHKKVANKQNARLDKADFNVKYNSVSIGALIFLVVFLMLASTAFPIYYLCDVPDGPPLVAAIAWFACCVAAAILSLVFLFAFKRWRIEVSDEKITFVPFFGKSREYGWDDFSRVTRDDMYGRSVYKVFVKQCEKKAFSFATVMVGGQLFADKLCERGLIPFSTVIYK